MSKVCYFVFFVLSIVGLCVTIPCPCADKSLCKPLEIEPRSEVFAFVLETTNAKYYPLDIITTICTFSPYQPDLLCRAKENNVRYVVAAEPGVSSLLNETQRAEMIASIVKQMQDYYLDGINFDIEQAVPLNSNKSRAIVSFLKELRAAFDKHVSPYAQITLDGTFAPDVWGRGYDYLGMQPYLDFNVMMEYDMTYEDHDDACMASANSPYDSVKSGIEEYIKIGMDPFKLVVAQPWYGYDWVCYNHNDTAEDAPPGPCNICAPPPPTATPSTAAPTKSPTSHVDESNIKMPKRAERDHNGFFPSSRLRHRFASGNVGATVQQPYMKIVGELIPNKTSQVAWSDKFLCPYFDYKADDGQRHQVWYDDLKSLTIKYSLVQDYELRGVSMWHVDCLNYSLPLQTKEVWATTQAAFQGKTQ